MRRSVIAAMAITIPVIYTGISNAEELYTFLNVNSWDRKGNNGETYYESGAQIFSKKNGFIYSCTASFTFQNGFKNKSASCKEFDSGIGGSSTIYSASSPYQFLRRLDKNDGSPYNYNYRQAWIATGEAPRFSACVSHGNWECVEAQIVKQ